MDSAWYQGERMGPVCQAAHAGSPTLPLSFSHDPIITRGSRKLALREGRLAGKALRRRGMEIFRRLVTVTGTAPEQRVENHSSAWIGYITGQFEIGAATGHFL